MTSKQADELRAIREEQEILRVQLAALDRRIAGIGGQMEEERAEEMAETSVPSAPPTPPPASLPPPLPDPDPVKESGEGVACGALPEMPRARAVPSPPMPREEASLEMQFGRVWLARMGIVILLTGLVFLGNFAWQEVIGRLGPAGKLALIYLAGIGLAAAGAILPRIRAHMRGYANVLAGGGLAAIYYATYAAHFVPSLRVISSPLVGGFLLLLLAAGILWLADRRRWETVATITTALAFYTAAINPHGGFALFSNLVLSVMTVILFARKRWKAIPFVTLLGCYLGYVFWRFHNTGTLFFVSVDAPAAFSDALLFPGCYWAVFTVATFWGRGHSFECGAREVFLTLNNGAFYGLAAPVVAGTHPGGLWLFSFAFGVILLGLSQLARRTAAEEHPFDAAYLAQGLALISLGLLLRFSGYQAAIVFALQSAALVKISTWRHGRIFQVFSGLAALAAAGFAVDGLQRGTPQASLTAAAVAVVFLLNARVFKATRGRLEPAVSGWRAGAFVALATVLGLMATLEALRGVPALCVLVVVGILLSATLRWHRLRELVFSGGVFALAAIIHWLALRDLAAALPCALVVLSGLFHLHWWQRSGPQAVRIAWQAVHSLAVVGVLLFWMVAEKFTPGATLLAAASLAFLISAHAGWTRLWSLLLSAQFFSGLFLLLFPQIVGRRIPWPFALGALVVFALQTAVMRGFLGRMPPGVQRVLGVWRQVLGAALTLYAVLAVATFVPGCWVFLSLAAGGFVLFLWFVRSASQVVLVHACVVAVCAACAFLHATVGSLHPFWANGYGLLLPLVAQRLLRGTSFRRALLGAASQTILILAGLLGFWLWIGAIIASNHQGVLQTVAWSVYAAAVLAMGFLLKERTYRLAGLGLLCAAVARIVLVDVWQLDTGWRIVSFLILGVLLLACGFLYNRFSAVLRRLL